MAKDDFWHVNISDELHDAIYREVQQNVYTALKVYMSDEQSDNYAAFSFFELCIDGSLEVRH
jgi:hypothetical protein